LNCPYCDIEILHEDATFCPKCGKSLATEGEIEQSALDVQQKRTDLVLAAAILSIISAAFISSLGYIGIYQYITLLAYYDSSLILGFLIFGIIGIIASVLALAGGTFMLKRKRFILSTLGFIFPLISVVSTYITILYYNYGFSDIITITFTIITFILSIMSGILILTSKAEFS